MKLKVEIWVGDVLGLVTNFQILDFILTPMGTIERLKEGGTRSVWLKKKNYSDKSVENELYRFKTSSLSFLYSIVSFFPFALKVGKISQDVSEANPEEKIVRSTLFHLGE